MANELLHPKRVHVWKLKLLVFYIYSFVILIKCIEVINLFLQFDRKLSYIEHEKKFWKKHIL